MSLSELKRPQAQGEELEGVRAGYSYSSPEDEADGRTDAVIVTATHETLPS